MELLQRILSVYGLLIYWPVRHIPNLCPAILLAWTKPLGRLVTLYRKDQLRNLSVALSTLHFVGPFYRLSGFLPGPPTGWKFGRVCRTDSFGHHRCFHFVALL